MGGGVLPGAPNRLSTGNKERLIRKWMLTRSQSLIYRLLVNYWGRKIALTWRHLWVTTMTRWLNSASLITGPSDLLCFLMEHAENYSIAHINFPCLKSLFSHERIIKTIKTLASSSRKCQISVQFKSTYHISCSLIAWYSLAWGLFSWLFLRNSKHRRSPEDWVGVTLL